MLAVIGIGLGGLWLVTDTPYHGVRVPLLDQTKRIVKTQLSGSHFCLIGRFGYVYLTAAVGGDTPLRTMGDSIVERG